MVGVLILYFGIFLLVYYDVEIGLVYMMNVEWNIVFGEDFFGIILGGVDMMDVERGILGCDLSGCIVFVGGFMKGVGVVYDCFGCFFFVDFFVLVIYIVEEGFLIFGGMVGYWEM